MNKTVDPLTPLTPQEKKKIKELSTLPRDEILKELKDNLQTAVWIELATIPIYLYTYYSIQRAEKSGEDIRPADLFANKAGGVIMSVAVEEMLHMSLGCNILYSLGVDPKLYQHSPGPYPTPLPYHNPIGPPGPHGDRKVLIPLSKFTYDQLWHFLQIEYPEAPKAWPKDRNWNSIGQFYSYIRCLICCPQIKDEDFQVRGPNSSKYQIQPFNYSPNNIDTAHPKAKFDPWGIPPAQGAGSIGKTGGYPTAAEATKFSNAADSYVGPTPLATISCKLEALQAIDTICDQGEGFRDPKTHQEERTDDPSHHEDSHYYKFLKLQAQLEQYPHHVEKLAPSPKPPDPIKPTITAAELAEVIVNFPDNPVTRPVGSTFEQLGDAHISDLYVYPERFRALSDLCNGVYQYMLIMTETIFKVASRGPEGGGQKLFFNVGLHRSMIWILDKLVQAMRGFDICDGQTPGANFSLAPTFENIDLGDRKEAYGNLIKLADAITDPDQLSAVGYYIGTIKTLPDVAPYW